MLSVFLVVKVCGLRLRLFDKLILQPHYRAQDSVAYAWYNPILWTKRFWNYNDKMKMDIKMTELKNMFTKKIVYFVMFGYIISFSVNFFHFCNNDVLDCITSTGARIQFPKWQRGIPDKDGWNSLLPNLNESQKSFDSAHHFWDVLCKKWIWCHSLGYWVLLS